jgi:hypothetical protein
VENLNRSGEWRGAESGVRSNREQSSFPECSGGRNAEFLTCGVVKVPEFLSKPVELNSDHVPTEMASHPRVPVNAQHVACVHAPGGRQVRQWESHVALDGPLQMAGTVNGSNLLGV